MGEIGLNRQEYLYDLTFCELLCIDRGYYRRSRDIWSAARWETYNIMLAQCGSESMKKAGIHNPTDLIKFPWEKEPAVTTSTPTEKEIAEMQAMMREMNAQNEKSDT